MLVNKEVQLSNTFLCLYFFFGEKKDLKIYSVKHVNSVNKKIEPLDSNHFMTYCYWYTRFFFLNEQFLYLIIIYATCMY